MRKTLLIALPVALLGLASAAPAPQKLTLNLSEMKITGSAPALRAGVPAEITVVNSGKVEHELQAYALPKSTPKNWDAYAGANKLWKGTPARLSVEGKPVQGDFTEVLLKPGQRAVLRFTPQVKGAFELACRIPGHYEAGMKSGLVIQ